jgi:hypothetical protein
VPDRAPLADRQGRHRRFRTARAAKAAVDQAWPWPRPLSKTWAPRGGLDWANESPPATPSHDDC